MRKAVDECALACKTNSILKDYNCSIEAASTFFRQKCASSLLLWFYVTLYSLNSKHLADYT